MHSSQPDYTRPNQLRMSVVDVGVGKSRMASMYLGNGLDGFVRYAEPCEINNSPHEIEFLCIEDDSCLA